MFILTTSNPKEIVAYTVKDCRDVWVKFGTDPCTSMSFSIKEAEELVQGLESVIQELQQELQQNEDNKKEGKK